MSLSPSLTWLLAALRLLAVGLHLLSGVLQVALLFRVVSRVRRRLLRQLWSRQLLLLLGVRLEPAALNTAGPVAAFEGLIVSNHISFVDIFVINALAPAAFVCKEDVAHWPLIGWLCRGTETIFLVRGSRSAAYFAHRQIVSRLQSGERIAVFPEGTTSIGDRVLPFHGTLFQSAIDAGVPVVCLALSYHDRRGRPTKAAAYTGDLSILQCLWQIAAAGDVRAYQHLIGCASIGMADGGHNAANLFKQLSPAQIAPIDYRVEPRDRLPLERLANGLPAFMPPLIKGYLRAGAWVCGESAWDPDFHTADMLLHLPLSRFNTRYARHFVKGAA